MDSPAYDDISLLLLMAQAKPEALNHLYFYHHYYSLFVSLNHNQAFDNCVCVISQQYVYVKEE